MDSAREKGKRGETLTQNGRHDGLKRRILGIILANPRGIKPKPIFERIHGLHEETGGCNDVSPSSVRARIKDLKDTGLIAELDFTDGAYHVPERCMEQVYAYLRQKKRTPRYGAVRPTETPQGKGWAAHVITVQPARFKTLEEIYLEINCTIDASEETVRRWISRLNNDGLIDKKRIKAEINRMGYRPRQDRIGPLIDLAKDVKEYIYGTENEKNRTPRTGCPHRCPKNISQTKITKTENRTPPGPSSRSYPSRKTPKITEKPDTLSDRKPGLVANGEQTHITPHITRKNENKLDTISFYDENAHPRVRISNKRRIYPLLPGVHEIVRELLFNINVKATPIGPNWTQYQCNAVLTRDTRYGPQDFKYTLFLKTRVLEIHMEPWEGYDVFRMDMEMNQFLDDIMDTLVWRYGEPFTGPGKTIYRNQELEHWDNEVGWTLIEADAASDSKMQWMDNHRVWKWYDFSRAHREGRGDIPDVGTSRGYEKALQLQSSVFQNEIRARTHEMVRHVKDKQREQDSSIESIQTQLQQLRVQFEGLGSEIVETVSAALQATKGQRPSVEAAEVKELTEDDEVMFR